MKRALLPSILIFVLSTIYWGEPPVAHAASFTVNSLGAEHDNDLSDGICDITGRIDGNGVPQNYSGICTLPAACDSAHGIGIYTGGSSSITVGVSGTIALLDPCTTTWPAQWDGNGVTVTGNWIGLWADDSSMREFNLGAGARILNIDSNDSEITQITMSGATDECGISVIGQRNKIYDNSVTERRWGICVTGLDNEIYANHVFGNTHHGIFVHESFGYTSFGTVIGGANAERANVIELNGVALPPRFFHSL